MQSQICPTHVSKDKTFIIITGFFLTVIILATIVHHKGVLAATSDLSNITSSKNTQNNILLTNILAKNLENHLQKAGDYQGNQSNVILTILGENIWRMRCNFNSIFVHTIFSLLLLLELPFEYNVLYLDSVCKVINRPTAMQCFVYKLFFNSIDTSWF